MRTKLIVVIIFICVAFCNCVKEKNSKRNNIIDNQAPTEISKDTDMSDNEIKQNLHEVSQNQYLEFYNDLNYLGIGVINPQNYAFTVITDTITGNGFEIDNIENQTCLIPVFWKPDYMIFYMPVVHIFDKYYEVRANETMNVFVNKNEFDFYTWDELLKKALCIIADKGYSEPDIHSEILYDSEERDIDVTSLIVEKVDGDWLYVKEEYEELAVDYFWVHWRDKNKLLVKPIFLM